jgi:hypothetical protein
MPRGARRISHPVAPTPATGADPVQSAFLIIRESGIKGFEGGLEGLDRFGHGTDALFHQIESVERRGWEIARAAIAHDLYGLFGRGLECFERGLLSVRRANAWKLKESPVHAEVDIATGGRVFVGSLGFREYSGLLSLWRRSLRSPGSATAFSLSRRTIRALLPIRFR